MWNVEGMEQMATCAKSVIENTCLHKDEYSVHHAGDMEEVRGEIIHVIKHLKHIQRSLSKEVYSDKHADMWNYFDKMIVIAKDLQKTLRNPENHNVDRHNHLIHEAREDLLEVFNEMVKHCIEDDKLHHFYKIK